MQVTSAELSEENDQQSLLVASKMESYENAWKSDAKIKISSVGLNLCLHLGIIPPDTAKPRDCANLECWIDPASFPHVQKASEIIGNKLQSQYENIQPKTKYRLLIDSSIDDIKKQFISLRKHAKSDRVLIHYVGHGVPKPTTNGEIWVFNKAYTQYIPLSIYEIDMILGRPALYIFDMPCCANIINHLQSLITSAGNQNISNYAYPIMYFASTGNLSMLPMNSDLPMDLLTSCLTSPVEFSLYWFLLNNRKDVKINGKKMTYLDAIKQIPGKHNDRKSILGELCWIFTCIVDNIAWEIVPRPLFKILFRQDLLLSTLFRNFLLASKLMPYFGITPVSYPELPDASYHPLWEHWINIIEEYVGCIDDANEIHSLDLKKPFFEHHILNITALCNNVQRSKTEIVNYLPILLQILLSHDYRTFALKTFCCLFEADSEFIEQSLYIGIFPYLLKLLHTPGVENRIIMAQIWTCIFRHFPKTVLDFCKDNSVGFFLETIEDSYTRNDTNSIYILQFFYEYLKIAFTIVEFSFKGPLFSLMYDWICQILISTFNIQIIGLHNNLSCMEYETKLAKVANCNPVLSVDNSQTNLHLFRLLLEILGIFVRSDFSFTIQCKNLLQALVDNFYSFHECSIRKSVIIFFTDFLHLLNSAYPLQSVEYEDFIRIEKIIDLSSDVSSIVRLEMLKLVNALISASKSKITKSISNYLLVQHQSNDKESQAFHEPHTIYDVIIDRLFTFLSDYDMSLVTRTKEIISNILKEIPNNRQDFTIKLNLFSELPYCCKDSSEFAIKSISSCDLVDCWKLSKSKEMNVNFYYKVPLKIYKFDAECEQFYGFDDNGFFSKISYPSNYFTRTINQAPSHDACCKFRYPLISSLMDCLNQIELLGNDDILLFTKDDFLLIFNLNESPYPYLSLKLPLKNTAEIHLLDTDIIACSNSNEVAFISVSKQSEIMRLAFSRINCLQSSRTHLNVIHDDSIFSSYTSNGNLHKTFHVNCEIPKSFCLSDVDELLFLIYENRLVTVDKHGNFVCILKQDNSQIAFNNRNNLLVAVEENEFKLYEIDSNKPILLYQLQSISIRSVKNIFIHSLLPIVILDENVIFVGILN